MNTVNLTGRLTSDPKPSQHGDTTVCDFRLAVPRGRDRADFIDVVAFGKLAETVATHLVKGRRIAVCGRLRHNEWETDGKKHHRLDVVADDIEFLDNRARDSGNESTEA